MKSKSDDERKIPSCLWSMLLIYIAFTLGVIFAIASIGAPGIILLIIELASIQPFIQNIYIPLHTSNLYKEALAAEKDYTKSLKEGQRLYIEKINELSRLAFYSADYSKDVMAAVKYAMNKSHPDNGGSTEDFIRYKKVYDKLKDHLMF